MSHAQHSWLTKGSSRTLLILISLGTVAVVTDLAVGHYLIQCSKLPNNMPALPYKPLNAPFIKSSDAVVERMVDAAHLDANKLVYDLGCGDGRIVITAALRSGCRGIGFDIDPKRVAEARRNVTLHGVGDRVRIKQQDVFTVDLKKADVVMMYLLPWMVNKLRSQVDQMPAGHRIVSHDFWFDGVVPDQIIHVAIGPDEDPHLVFIYTTPLRKDRNGKKGMAPERAKDGSTM